MPRVVAQGDGASLLGGAPFLLGRRRGRDASQHLALRARVLGLWLKMRRFSPRSPVGSSVPRVVAQDCGVSLWRSAVFFLSANRPCVARCRRRGPRRGPGETDGAKQGSAKERRRFGPHFRGAAIFGAGLTARAMEERCFLLSAIGRFSRAAAAPARERGPQENRRSEAEAPEGAEKIRPLAEECETAWTQVHGVARASTMRSLVSALRASAEGGVVFVVGLMAQGVEANPIPTIRP